jgi:hypothetical protein
LSSWEKIKIGTAANGALPMGGLDGDDAIKRGLDVLPIIELEKIPNAWVTLTYNAEGRQIERVSAAHDLARRAKEADAFARGRRCDTVHFLGILNPNTFGHQPLT